MFDRFGKMRTVEELNAKAEKLKYFGDKEGLKELCIENGIMLADAHCYMEGITAVLATLEEAATGRIYVELKEIDARESVMICGIVDMLRYVVRSDDNLHRSADGSTCTSSSENARRYHTMGQAGDSRSFS